MHDQLDVHLAHPPAEVSPAAPLRLLPKSNKKLPHSFTDQPRDVIWQIFTKKEPIDAKAAKHGGRLQHHQPRPYVERVQATGSPELKAILGEPERWGFETLGEEEMRRTTAAEPLWPEGRPDEVLAPRVSVEADGASKL